MRDSSLGPPRSSRCLEVGGAQGDKPVEADSPMFPDFMLSYKLTPAFRCIRLGIEGNLPETSNYSNQANTTTYNEPTKLCIGSRGTEVVAAPQSEQSRPLVFLVCCSFSLFTAVVMRLLMLSRSQKRNPLWSLVPPWLFGRNHFSSPRLRTLIAGPVLRPLKCSVIVFY